ncbi:MAG: hypothetical protein U0935_19550 [Pirellulales bacterium]
MPHVQAPQARCRFALAHADITPPVGMYHRMWGAATHERSAGVHRPLRATVVVLAPRAEEPSAGVSSGDRNGAGTVILAALDHCLVGEEELRLLLQPVQDATGLPSTAVTVVFSHTHAAGLMTLDRQSLPGGEQIPAYLRSVGERLAELVVGALARLEPATLVFGSGRCTLAAFRDQWDESTGQFVCGYDPQQAADDTVLVARVTSDAGEVRATIVNYACHPTTLAWDNQRISPDYIGALREVVEQATGAPCLFLQGASGELGPVEGYVGDVEVADRNGRQLAYAALSALTALPPPGTRYDYAGPVVSGATIGVWRHKPLTTEALDVLARWQSRRWVIRLDYRAELPTPDGVADELRRWQASEAEARVAGDEVRVRDCRAMVERQTRMARRLAQLPPGPSYPLEVRLWRLGDAAFLAVPGEHYSLLQTALRGRFPGVPLLIATIAQGWGPSYLPTRATYGRGIYQESIAIVAPGSLERVIDEVGRVLAEWWS